MAQEGSPDPPGHQIEHRVAKPDPKKHPKEGRLPTQAAGRRQQGRADRWHILLHQGEQAERRRLHRGEPSLETQRQHEKRGRVHRVACFSLWATVDGATPKRDGTLTSISRAITEIRA